MKEKKKTVSLMSTVLFTICSVIALDSFASPAIIGVPVLTVWVIAAVFFLLYALLGVLDVTIDTLVNKNSGSGLKAFFNNLFGG